MQLTALFTYVILATAAFAAPRPKDVLLERGNITIATRDNLISSNTAGAVLVPPEDKIFNGVTGMFKVPTLAAGDPSAVSIWVGLDGLTTHHVIQAGVDAILTSDGEVSYTAWFEWYPNPLTYFEDFSIQKGDTIFVGLVITGAGTTAQATLTNQRTDSVVNREFYSPSEDDDAVGSDAQWVIEEPPNFDLAKFETVDIMGCTARTAGDNKVLPIDGAQGLTLQQIPNPPKAVGSIESGGFVRIVRE